MDKNRMKNDEITANRRETKDGNFNAALAVSLVLLGTLVIQVIFVSI